MMWVDLMVVVVVVVLSVITLLLVFFVILFFFLLIPHFFLFLFFFFLMLRRPPSSTLFPSPTLFGSFTRRVTVFELGAVFHPRADSLLPDEPLRLCALLTGPREPASWLAGAEPPGFDFYDVKGVAEALLAGLEVEQVT